MKTLAAQQKQFQESVLSGRYPESLLDARHGHCAHLDIYQHAYRARLTDALRDNFSVLHQVLGDEGFHELALAYIEQKPSRHPSIRWFGDQLVDFLITNPDLLPHPALLDLAQMEWALRTAFDAADDKLLSVEALAAIDPELWPNTVFTLHPSCFLLKLEWDVEALWQMVSEDENADNSDSSEPIHHPHNLLVWRAGLTTRWRILDDTEASLLSALKEGQSFGDLCSLAAELIGDDQAASLVAGLLRRWIEESLLLAVLRF